ncbi:hypothetical protein [Paludibaculum fermentans]|uniref:hypothetical protein n=1 Tax=Paludibaculum fermentans TaxID=1473598 RepID=UPI003EBDEAEA
MFNERMLNALPPEQRDAWLKQRAEAQAKNLRIAIETKRWFGYLFVACGNGERPDAFRTIAPYLTDEEYWSLLGAVWTEYDAVIVFEPTPWYVWEELFTANRPKRSHLMSRSERRTLRGLPRSITVYRGCRAGFELEMSWTLSPAVARAFAQRQTMLLNDEAYVISAQVRRADVYAYFNGKKEREVVWQPSLDTAYEIVETMTGQSSVAA